jgi:hypothetical protein
MNKCGIRGCLFAVHGEICDWHAGRCAKCELCLKWFTKVTLVKHGGYCVRCFDKDLHERKIDQYNPRKTAAEIANRFNFYRKSNPTQKDLREEYREARQQAFEEGIPDDPDDGEAELEL